MSSPELKQAKPCETCGGSLLYVWKDPKSGRESNYRRKRFCSKTCADVWRHHSWYDEAFVKGSQGSRKETNPRFNAHIPDCKCFHCGKVFRKYPAAILNGRGKYCSRACLLAAKVQERVTCDVCGKRVPRPPSRIKEAKRHFCSKACEAISNRGKGNPFYGKKHSEFTLKRILSQIHSKPNGAERHLIGLFLQYELPFKYVGNGALFIGGLNPDFINTNGQKQVIELFGHGFHDPSHRLRRNGIRRHQTEEGRKELFLGLGFETLIIWDSELKLERAVIDKVIAFMKGGDKNVGET